MVYFVMEDLLSNLLLLLFWNDHSCAEHSYVVPLTGGLLHTWMPWASLYFGQQIKNCMIKKMVMSQPIPCSQLPLLAEIKPSSGESYSSFNLFREQDHGLLFSKV
jgi:hypothetical protein